MKLFSVRRNATRNRIEISIVTEDNLSPCVTAAFFRTGVDQLEQQQTFQSHFLSRQLLFEKQPLSRTLFGRAKPALIGELCRLMLSSSLLRGK